jgi:hypothetical protein
VKSEEKTTMENFTEISLSELEIVSGGTFSETAPGSGSASHTNSGWSGGETNSSTRNSECGAGRNGGLVICVPNKE